MPPRKLRLRFPAGFVCISKSRSICADLLRAWRELSSLLPARHTRCVFRSHNPGCPYTQKHYESGNMQHLQKEWTNKGVVWLTVISSAPGEQGYVTAQQENDYASKMKASPTAALLDPRGDVGKLYSAKTTPHMFVVNPAGVLIYDGAIDSKATTEQADISTAKNYVSQALEDSIAG